MHLPTTVIFVLFQPPCVNYFFFQTHYPVIKTDESYNPKEQLFFVPKQLKMVEIRCVNKNELVEKLLLLLMTNGVPSEQIQIEQDFSPLDCMLFISFLHFFKIHYKRIYRSLLLSDAYYCNCFCLQCLVTEQIQIMVIVLEI
jgi:hypothetical protein